MGWDASRPVPWTRLCKEWAIYAAIMAAIFAIFLRGGGLLGLLGGLLASLPLYLLLGYVLAKLGYQRKTLAELRTPRAAPSDPGGGSTADGRPRPAPTRRTAGGDPRRPSSARKRR